MSRHTVIATPGTLRGTLVPLICLSEEESVGDVGHDVAHVTQTRAISQLSLSPLYWRQPVVGGK